MDNRRPEELLAEVEDLIERIEEIEELGAPESEAAGSRRTLSPAEVELANEFDGQAREVLDPEAYAEIAPFTADESTSYEVYWDRLRELRAALEELRDGLRKTWLQPTEQPDSPDEDRVGGPRSQVPESEQLD
jgi:hypothetical protein